MMSGEVVADLEALYQESVGKSCCHNSKLLVNDHFSLNISDEVNNLNQAFMTEGSSDGLPLGRFVDNK